MYFRSEVVDVRKTAENDAYDGFGWNLLKTVKATISKFYTLIVHNKPHMTSLAVSGRMQNAIKYCTKVRKTGAAGTESHNSVTV